jgi:hypothetical protein
MDKVSGIFLRYLLAIISSVNSLWIFYLIFTPLTLYPSYFILGLFYSASLEQSTIIINGTLISLIDACIAGAAYFLLTALNLLTPDLSIGKRILVLLFEYSGFLIANIIRIVVLSLLLLKGSSYFTEAHIISWHVVSALFVVAIWIAAVKLFRIKSIPFYSDFMYLRSLGKK